MTIASEIQRLQNAKISIRQSIESKGVVVPIDAKIDGYSELIDNIQQGLTPTGEINITENGNYDVTEYATAEVLINGAGPSKVVLNYNTASLVTSYNEESNYIVGNTISFTDILNDQNVNINYNTASETLTYNGGF